MSAPTSFSLSISKKTRMALIKATHHKDFKLSRVFNIVWGSPLFEVIEPII